MAASSPSPRRDPSGTAARPPRPAIASPARLAPWFAPWVALCIALPLADDGINADGVLGVSDYIDPNLTGDALREALEGGKREVLEQIARQTARADIQRRANALGIPAGALDDLSALANELARKRTDLDAIASWLDQERARIAALPTAGEWVRGLLANGFIPVSIKVVDAAGNVVAKANPKTILTAVASFNLPSAGTYYLVVDGVGVGDPLNTGYSDYGSLGQYSVAGTVRAP